MVGIKDISWRVLWVKTLPLSMIFTKLYCLRKRDWLFSHTFSLLICLLKKST